MIRKGWRLTLCHVLPALFSLGIVAPIVMMLTDRLDPVVVRDTAISGDLRPGGLARIDWTATALRMCDGEVRRRLISSAGIVYEYDVVPTVIRSPGDLAQRNFYREITLPTTIPPGLTTHSVVVRYYCNPLQRWLNWPIIPPREDTTFMVKTAG